MSFNSLKFLVFYIIFYALYWCYSKFQSKFQNFLILIASYYFYSCWSWKFLFLLMFSTCVDYFTGLKISQITSLPEKRLWLLASITINLGLLIFFKYYNFFATSLINLFDKSAKSTDAFSLNVILPIGISFYTFHGLSYIIDIYKNKIQPEKNFINYSVFVSFFPLLVAGPIERASHLLPQIKRKRDFNYTDSVNGLRQVLWGLFKKVVVADQASKHVNIVFNNPNVLHNGADHFAAAVLFSIQIYCDFSGYSDIALGVAKLLGFDLIKNFSYPYFSRDVAEFWRRWHISLSSWFKDYVYIPLGGNNGTTFKVVRNIFIVFLLSGFWHGANWTFIFWGGLNALFILPSFILKKNRQHITIVAPQRLLPGLKDFLKILFTFILITISWIFFRADSITKAFTYLKFTFLRSLLSKPSIYDRKLLCAIILLIVMEWLGREKEFAIANFEKTWPKILRWLFYYILVLAIVLSSAPKQQFIYFQF